LQLNVTKWIYGGGDLIVGLVAGFLLPMLRRDLVNEQLE